MKVGGRLVLLDVNFPANWNWIGMASAHFMARLGDILRDMSSLFDNCQLEYEDHEIGAFGSLHFYIAT